MGNSNNLFRCYSEKRYTAQAKYSSPGFNLFKINKLYLLRDMSDVELVHA